MVAYVVMIRDEMTNQAEFDTYSQMAGPAGAGHPLTPLAVYGKHVTLEGPEIEGAVILSFPTIDEAKTWYDSPAYQEAAKHRKAGAVYRGFIVEGIG
ncbi:DUF1330 domain-containing protein [Flavisphingomonas formosensis]|uniref:DUF1330 domain-containing protein n=1 Tax=Flavisphingomonas formosensis TaxID=861534 RepID=UPI0012F77848|nr:DUF1330 domain-containing protein [Sphingomonas formosensis]